jgi:hypothetical protein
MARSIMSEERAARRAAIHESGHVIVCWCKGIRIETVALYARGGGSTKAHLFANHQSPQTYDEAHRALIVLSAGAAAERHLFRAVELAEDDDTSMTNMLAPFRIAPDVERSWRRRARREARELVQTNWHRIELVADALMKRGAIAGGDVLRLLGPSHVIGTTSELRHRRDGKVVGNKVRRNTTREALLPVVNPNGNKVLGEVRVKGGKFEAIRGGVSLGVFASLAEAARAV